MPRLTDTSREAERVLAECHRNMSPARKIQLVEDARRTAYSLHQTGFKSRHPDASSKDIWRDWIRKTLGPEYLFVADRGNPMDALRTEAILFIREVMDYLKQVGAARALGGSFASSVHGDDRHTKDADIAATPFPGREAEFVALLGDRYYWSLDAIREANRDRSMFNVIHFQSGFKVDVFIQKVRLYDRNLTLRSTPKMFGADPAVTLDVISPEDVILLKLEWYRLGDESSDTQWKDILGVMRTQGNRLDNAYLDLWAADLGVSDLLAKARVAVG